MFKMEFKSAARLAATAGLGLSLAFAAAPVVAMADSKSAATTVDDKLQDQDGGVVSGTEGDPSNEPSTGDTGDATPSEDVIAVVTDSTGTERGSYNSLSEAIKNVSEGGTVKLTQNASGNGVQVAEGKKFTLDLGEFTYTIDGKTVGSTGTETNGFQLLKDSTITIKNGTITSNKALILIQNYCNLTLEDVDLIGGAQTGYVLSNNNGTTHIGEGTNITATEGNVAFDVCRFSDYPSVTVIVDKGAGKITGKIEMSDGGKGTGDFKLEVNGGDLSSATLSFYGETVADAITVEKDSSVVIAAPDGYRWVDNGNGPKLEEIPGDDEINYFEAVAQIGDVQYKSLDTAIQSAKDGQTIKLVGDVDNEDDCLAELTDKAITLDLAGHTLKITTAWTPLTINGENAKLTITDSSDEGTGTIISTNADPVIQVTQGELDFQSGTLEVWDKWEATGPNGEKAYFGADGIRVYGSSKSTATSYSVVRVGADATIKNLEKDNDGHSIGSGYAIDVNYDKSSGSMHAYGVRVEFNGTTENAGMYVNGSIKDTTGNVPELALGEGAQIDGMIYAAGYAKWTIEGAEIAGDTGMEIRAGELTMTAGSITGEGQVVDVQPNGNGSTTSGAGLAIAQHTTKLPIKVNVSGGTISGYTAFYESTPQEGAVTDVIKLSITGGSFVAINGGKNAVYSASKDGFISGGSFSSSPVEYLDPYCAARVNSSTSYTVMKRGELPAGTYVVPKGAKPLTSDDFQSGLIVTVDPDTGQATATRPQTPSKGEHAVKVEQAEGGKVSVTPARADEGDKVTITATPDKGQEVRSVTVTTKDGKKVKVVKGSKANTWTFEMPDAEVTVKVAFGCDGGELCPTHEFDDVDADAWYHDAVDWAVEEGLLSGYADGTLGPDGTLSRAQLATVLWRQAGEPEAKNDASFADCDPEAFYAEAVAWADEAGIIAGYGDGTNFGPEDPVTREQLATILWRQAGEPEGKGDLDKYPDGGDATDYAVPALEWAVDTGVLSGFGDGSLAPGGVLSRAMLAAMLQRMAE